MDRLCWKWNHYCLSHYLSSVPPAPVEGGTPPDWTTTAIIITLWPTDAPSVVSCRSSALARCKRIFYLHARSWVVVVRSDFPWKPVAEADGHLTPIRYYKNIMKISIWPDHVGNQRVQLSVDPAGDFDIVRDMVATPEATGIPPDLVARAVRHEKPLERTSVFVQHCDETPQRYRSIIYKPRERCYLFFKNMLVVIPITPSNNSVITIVHNLHLPVSILVTWTTDHYSVDKNASANKLYCVQLCI